MQVCERFCAPRHRSPAPRHIQVARWSVPGAGPSRCRVPRSYSGKVTQPESWPCDRLVRLDGHDLAAALRWIGLSWDRFAKGDKEAGELALGVARDLLPLGCMTGIARLMEEGKLPVPENTTGFRLAIQDIETGDSAFVMVLCDDPAAHRRVPASAPPRRAESEAEFRERLSRMVAGSSATAAMRAAQADVAARQPPAEPVDLADEYRKMGLI